MTQEYQPIHDRAAGLPRPRHPVILFREGAGMMDENELAAAKKHFVTVKSRMSVSGNSLVIGRYSVLPYYSELENDLNSVGAKLINSYGEHRYVADLQNYAADLDELTPKTWSWRDFPYLPDMPLVVKGETNSKKDKWNTHMFAPTKADAIAVYQRLMDDSLLSRQQIYVREYVPLKKLGVGLYEQPITVEFRFFVLHGKVVSSGFYWSNHLGDIQEVPSPSMVPQEFLEAAIDRVKDNVSFFVMDVALTESGRWIVVELNDGQMSGLSENDPNVLYGNMKKLLWTNP